MILMFIFCFQGAFWGLMVGLLVGLIRFIWEYAYSVPPCGESGDNRPEVISKVHYLHFGCILFLLCVIVTVVVSLMTKPIDDKHVSYFNKQRNWCIYSRLANIGNSKFYPK